MFVAPGHSLYTSSHPRQFCVNTSRDVFAQLEVIVAWVSTANASDTREANQSPLSCQKISQTCLGGGGGRVQC